MSQPDDRPFNPLLFRLYASDLSEAIYQMIDRDKLRHEYPGGLRTRVIGSHKFVTLGDKTVMVGQMATDEEIAAALQLNGATAPATPLPPAPTIVTAAPIKKNLTGASFLAGLIRKQQADIRKQLADAGTEMTAAMTELQGLADEATNQVKTVKAETADLKAALGLNSNGDPEP